VLGDEDEDDKPVGLDDADALRDPDVFGDGEAETLADADADADADANVDADPLAE
jgi:hypothetical protein